MLKSIIINLILLMKGEIFLKILFFNLLLINTYSFWKENQEYKYENLSNLNNDFSILSDFNVNNQLNSGFEPDIIYKTIQIGEVKTELLYNEKIYNFDLSYPYNNKVIINFYSLDCHIKIVGQNNKENIDIIPISNYEYDSFYAIIESKNDQDFGSTFFKIKTLINSVDDYNNNRTFHLIINSFEINDIPNLKINDGQPFLLNFDNNYNNIELSYKLNKNQDYPILVSFFIKERVKFLITVSNGEEEFQKIVAYTDKILIENNFKPKTSSNITILIRKIEEKKVAVMIVKLTEDYSKPIYFQKNFLNLGFIPTNATYQFYYTEIFDEEAGQIFLNNKKYKGTLISRIVEKEVIECNILEDSECYPKEDDYQDNSYLIYDEYSQGLYFNSYYTYNCKDGCYLLLTYYSLFLNQNNNITDILGTEFTLLSSILKENNYNPQIINIPLNEYIFGIMNYFNFFNIYYYSIFIPEEEEIIFETQLNNIIFFAKSGIERFQLNGDLLIGGYSGELIYSIKIYRAMYITVAFTKYFNMENSNYYFRILQNNKNNYNLIYPLDTNQANLCITNNITGNYSCYFYVNNYYKDINDYTQLIIYAYGKEKLSYKVWPIRNKEENYYSIDINNLNYEKAEPVNDIFCKINGDYDADFFLIQIQSNYYEVLTILTYYYHPPYFFPTINIYSYKIFFFYKEKAFFDIYYKLFGRYRIYINNIAGTGHISFDNDNYISKISDKNIISFFMTYKNKGFFVESENNLLFSIKIDYVYNDIIAKEIKYDYDTNNVIEDFPLGFYLKEKDYKGTDINFYFNFGDSNDENKIIIKAYIIDYEVLKLITYKELLLIYDFSAFYEQVDGIYNDRLHSGLIVFDNEIINRNALGKDIYYLIIINNETIISNYSLDIHASSKDNSNFSLPINKYISGSFNLNNQISQIQKYYIKRNDEYNSSKYIIEFSTNYENLELIFTNIINETMELKGGIQKYYVNLNGTDSSTERYFEIVIKNTTDKDDKKDLQKANYVLKFYNIENEQETIVNNIVDVSFEFGSKGKDKYILKIINKKHLNENITNAYQFLYILNIYERNRLLNHEIINTISVTYSQNVFSYRTENPLQEESYTLNALLPNREYIASLFIKIQSKSQKIDQYYYSYEYNMKTNDINSNNLIASLLIFFIVVILILILVFLFFYRRIKRKNKALKDQVQQISFSCGIDENDINKKENKSFEDKDYETTFI